MTRDRQHTRPEEMSQEGSSVKVSLPRTILMEGLEVLKTHSQHVASG